MSIRFSFFTSMHTPGIPSMSPRSSVQPALDRSAWTHPHVRSHFATASSALFPLRFCGDVMASPSSSSYSFSFHRSCGSPNSDLVVVDRELQADASCCALVAYLFCLLD
jgi:hypothetical protein